MFGFLTRKRNNRRLVEELYAAIVERARDPVLFTDYGIADSFEGRFDALTLYAVLTTRRLKSMDMPASDLAQDLIDHAFAQFDRALRETGVGDLTVPKRMKTIASAFMGRAAAYDAALSAADAPQLAAAILRNVYASNTADGAAAKRLADLAWAFDQALISARIETLADTIKSAPAAAKIS